MSDSVAERRVRRAAQRQGLVVVKSRRRDPRAYDYGLYLLAEPGDNSEKAAQTAFRNRKGITLSDVEKRLG